MVAPFIPKELHIAEEDLTSDYLITSTVNGIARSKTLIVKDLMITPLSGNAPIHMERAKSCHIPDALKDVPTPQEVQSIPGLSHLAEKFPTKKEWPTLMLIGRDCTQAQKHIQYVSSEDNNQLAIQTPLGWTIMASQPKTHARCL